MPMKDRPGRLALDGYSKPLGTFQLLDLCELHNVVQNCDRHDHIHRSGPVDVEVILNTSGLIPLAMRANVRHPDVRLPEVRTPQGLWATEQSFLEAELCRCDDDRRVQIDR